MYLLFVHEGEYCYGIYDCHSPTAKTEYSFNLLLKKNISRNSDFHFPWWCNVATKCTSCIFKFSENKEKRYIRNKSGEWISAVWIFNSLNISMKYEQN